MESCNPVDKFGEMKRLADNLRDVIVDKNVMLLEMQRELEEKERTLQDYIQGSKWMQKIKEENENLKRAFELENENLKSELSESKKLVAELAEEIVNRKKRMMLQKQVQGGEEVQRIKEENEKLRHALDLQRIQEEKQKQELQSINKELEELKCELMENRVAFEETLSDNNRLFDLSHETANKNGKLLGIVHKLEGNERILQEHIQGKIRMQGIIEELKHDLDSRRAQEVELQNVKEDNEKLKRDSQNIKEDNEKLKRDLQISKEDYEKLKHDLQGIKEDNEKLKHDLASLKAQEMAQKPGESDCSMDVQVTELRQMLVEKDEELHDIDILNQTLMLREHMSNHELQDARKELINFLPEILDANTVIGLKRMGEVTQKPFQDACIQKLSIRQWELKSATLSSLWQDKVNNPKWHPFKQATIDGKLQEVIDEDDSQLKGLKSAWGEEVYNAVVNALLEMNEFNPSGRYIVSELWNFENGRKATVKEVIQCLIQQVKASKSLKRKRGGLRRS